MSSKKIGGGGEHVQPPLTQPAGVGPDTPAAAHDIGHHFKGAMFRHGHGAGPMRRGPTARMPLRGVGASRKRPGRTKVGGTAASDEPDGELSLDAYFNDEEHALQLQVGFQSHEEGSSDQSGDGERDKRRFAQIFQFAPVKEKSSGTSAKILAVTDLRSKARPTLPLLRSMRDIVEFVHASTTLDPTGKSVAATLRSINAAVMRGEISLPVVTRVAETRDILIEFFGVGHTGPDPLPPAMRSIHQMLPLWLVNLSKRRTAQQKAQAVARLTLCVGRS